MRHATRHGDVDRAQRLVDEQLARPAPSDQARLAAGLLEHHLRQYAPALEHFRQVEHKAIRITPLPYVDSLFRVDPAEGIARTRKWLADPELTPRARTWYTVLRHLFPLGEPELRHEVHERMVAAYAGDEQRWPEGAVEIAWLERWRGAGEHESAPAPTGQVAFGVLDYMQPGRDKSSQNIGDHIQTLASMGHLARRTNLRFHSDEPDLAPFVQELQTRVRPELRLDSPDGITDVRLYRVDRDGSTFQQFPPGTWMLEFGWFMHDLANSGTWNFPPHKNLLPLFVSFHCNKRGLLTDEVLDYLREHGPIGCRDWTTVDLLLSLDVPAFFSGCLTTTVSTVFPESVVRPADATVYVDSVRDPVPDGATKVRQSYAGVKRRSYVENMREAVRLLEWYRNGFTRVVTKRLHCYLPTTSLGMDVDFQPTYHADVRFNGLYRLDHEAFEAIRTGMLERLAPVLDAVLAQRPADEVYAIWRETVAPEVEAARRRHEAPAQVAPLALDPAALAAPVAVSASGTSTATDVVLVPRRSEIELVGDTVGALDASASGPLRVWVVGSGLDEVTLPDVSASTTVTLVPTEGLDLDAVKIEATQRPQTPLLGHLLPDVDRVVVAPVDGSAPSDVATLAEADLAGHVVGARLSTKADGSGFGVLYRAARRLDDAPAAAYEFYRRIHRRHRFDFDAFDTDTMVLDLDRMRQDDVASEALTAMRDFGLNAREALHLCTGPHRAGLDDQIG